MMEPSEYQEQQRAQQDRYLELLGDYKHKARGRAVQESDPLAIELDKVECSLLDNPPLSEVIDSDGQRTGEFKPRAKGLLPESESRLDPPIARPFRAEFSIIPVSSWSKYIGCADCVDMRNFVPDGMVLDQDGVGSCASESATGTVMALRVKAGQEPVKLNPWFVYHTVSGGYDGGSTLSDNVAFVQKYGVCSQAVYGRDKGWRAKPSDEAYQDALQYKLTELWRISTWEEFGTACILGFPVYFGYPGHAIWATKVLDENRLEYCNSWSPDWGDSGFGTLDKGRVQWGYGIYAMRVATEADR